MRGLILTGGKGKRLRPFTYTGAKQLVPIGNKPVLFYVIEDLVQAGISDIGIVVGDTADQITQAVGDGSRFGARVCYIQRQASHGTPHAIKSAREFLGEDRFVLSLGDTFVRDGIAAQVDAFRSGTLNAQLMVANRPDPGSTDVAFIDDHGCVKRVISRPQQFVSPYAVAGIYMFDHHVFEAVDTVKPSAPGELEIAELIQYLIDRNFQVGANVLTGGWIDTSKMVDVLSANRIVLDVLDSRDEGERDSASVIQGRVVLQAGARVINSIIRGPAIIGERTRIENAFIGPYTSIYHDCVIQNCEIENSVILEESRIVNAPARIGDSLIGRNVTIGRADGHTKTVKMMVGDYSNVGIL